VSGAGLFASTPRPASVVTAAVLHWLLGAVWFTVWKNRWLEGVGRTAEQLRASGQPPWLPHVVTLAANLALAFVLGWLILSTGPSTLARGVQMALVLWAGIAASVFATEYAFEARSLSTFAINAGYPLAGMILMGSVLGAWNR